MNNFEDRYYDPKSKYIASHDDSFVTGDSPVVVDVDTDLGQHGTDGYFANDGLGSILLEISHDGSTYEDAIKILPGEVFSLLALKMDKLRITWIADTAYRLFVRSYTERG